MGDRRATALSLPALLVLACGSPAALAETGPWYVGVAERLSHESNLYRVDTDTALGRLSRSDTVASTSLVAGLDQPFGRQRLFGSATLSANRYRNNDYLNDNSYALTGGLDWSSIERLSGNVNAVASRHQRSFSVDSSPGLPETRKNNESIEQLDTTFRVGEVTRLTGEATLGQRRVAYSAAEYAGSQYRQNRGSLGLRLRPGIATFGAALSLADSRYEASPVRAATGQAPEQVRRRSLDLSVNWPASGASTVYARLSPTRVTYREFTQRDFSGLTGALRWNWVPTGKLSFDTRFVHDISQDSNFETFGGPAIAGTSNTGRTSTELRITMGYEMTAKIGLTVALGSTHRRLEQTAKLAGLSVVTGAGSDDTNTLLIGLRWLPQRSLQLGCSAAREQRSATGRLTRPYRANTLNCYGQFTLQ